MNTIEYNASGTTGTFGTAARPVNGQLLFSELLRKIKRHTVLSEHAATALALWIIFSYAFGVMKIAPILGLTSPVKRCGKTTVLSLLEKLVFKPVTTSNITPAALFRIVESERPTLLIDEGDTFLRNSDDLNGIINSGHTQSSAYVIRTAGREVKKFSTWCPKVLAAIGTLPETLADRSIVIRMRRKRSCETVECLRDADPKDFVVLKSLIAQWCSNNLTRIEKCRPQLPNLENDRAKDNWAPLMAIADCIGQKCAEMAATAALSLSQDQCTPSSVAEELLADIAEIFEKLQLQRIRTNRLIVELCADPEKPWANFSNGRSVTPRGIAQILREFGIASKRLRKDAQVAWGYELCQFEDAFARYIPQKSNN